MSQLNLAVQEALRVLRAEANAQHNLIDVHVDLDDVENAIAALAAVEEKVRLFDGVPPMYWFAWRYPTGTVAYSTTARPRAGHRFALRDVDGKLWFNAIARDEHIDKLTFICERAI
ncbi:hypothetical protein CPT_Scapp_004 [Serratia phage Scapp]|uniref:Uncharacterized protein n=1 Tax=Serratia phage Scapp TaxID=2282409 RepID=A0A345L6N1_9CAUD|nr:hypothetical protein PP898_gp04 [Serratia phage Scapp]AXH50933.1 hypothetical protein CPT_Scapp_004 [Serratia phage Scapp]